MHNSLVFDKSTKGEAVNEKIQKIYGGRYERIAGNQPVADPVFVQICACDRR